MLNNKLNVVGVGGIFCKLLISKFANLSYSIKSNGYVSEQFYASTGLKQGNIMSPLLFNFYVHDMINHFDDSCAPVKMGELKVSTLQFADDVLVLAGTEAGFKSALTKFEGFCRSARLSVNPAKTRVVVFGQHKDKDKDINKKQERGWTI